jgi:hypothetical protein
LARNRIIEPFSTIFDGQSRLEKVCRSRRSTGGTQFLHARSPQAPIKETEQRRTVEEVEVMLKRYVILPMALAAAGGVPYVAVNEDLSQRVQQAYQGFSSDEESAEPLSPMMPVPLSEAAPLPSSGNGSEGASPVVPAPWNPVSASPVQTTVYRSLYDVFRFDVTPAWIQSQWPRVSTGWLEDGYEGYRVPLVTGTTPYDLHGSLTYFFDHRQRLQRIRFVGNTGEVRPLAELVTEYHGFKSHPSANVAFLTRSFNGRQTGVLKFTHASAIEASRARQQYAVTLEINSTGGPFVLSQKAQQMLEGEKLSGRW